MVTSVYLPSRFDLNSIDQFLRPIVALNGQPTDSSFVFDFNNLRFIDGSGFTVLRNTISWLHSLQCKVNFDNFRNTRREAINYLDDCGFFETYLKVPLSFERRLRNTTLPCLFIDRAHSFQFIDVQFSAWLANVLCVDPRSLGSLRTCLKEVFNNIHDHSKETTGFIHVQFYPNMHRVKITISDFGVGIPSTIKARFGNMTDAKAIEFAAREGVTSQSQPNNMGAGLNYLLDCISANDGEVMIHSQSGFLHCSLQKGRQVRKAFNRLGCYPGTLVDISIDDRLFLGDDFEEDRVEIEW